MGEPIAIVGSACRFAGGVSSPSKLWELLVNPRDVCGKIPNNRFNADALYHPDASYHGHSNVRHSYLLEQDVAAFDTEFFGITPKEAKAMDPQQRILLETVYEGLECAGLTTQGLRGTDTSVYVGVMCNDYEAQITHDLNTAPTYAATGIGRSIVSNRISYFFDWHGPSMTLGKYLYLVLALNILTGSCQDTACSSSLVAVHLAVQALRSRDSRIALACGSNLLLGPGNYVLESKLQMLSPDGRSKMWDRDANGYGRGEGVAAVVLKTLRQAIEDGDHIECVIRETGVNQDGATKGITMPSASAQQSLIQNTYAKAGLDARKDRPQFFEAHGTGTPAGDPIEAEAISKAFFGPDFAQPSNDGKLYVGSVKTMLGHTEGTAGLAALLKASLALQHSTIPANMLLNNPSETVANFTTNLEIPTTSRPWPQPVAGEPKRASVNSFGFGGTNAHAILESYDCQDNHHNADTAEDVLAPFLFSAPNRRALRATLTDYANFLDIGQSINMRDLAYTLHSRRSAFSCRMSFAAHSSEDLASKIRAELESVKIEDLGVKLSTSAITSSRPKILAIFTGQGSQYARMGASLLQKSIMARHIMAELQSHLDALPEPQRPDWDMLHELLTPSETSRVTDGALSCLTTAIQIMLVDLLRLAGVHLSAVVGHSSGEMSAAYAAGVLSARDCMCVAWFRSHYVSLMSSPNGPEIKGSMIAAGLSFEEAGGLCEKDNFKGRICVAAVNSSSSVTLSGDEDAVDEIKLLLDDEKKFNRKLRVDKAYHSNHLWHCAAPYVEAIRSAGVRANAPSDECLWISSVYCQPVTENLKLADEYWAENMVNPVFFHQALQLALRECDPDMVVEVGPHPALKGPATQIIGETLSKSVPYSGTLSRQEDAISSTAQSLGFMWMHCGGQDLDICGYEAAVNDGKSSMRVLKGLPTYHWNHDVSYWHEPRASRKMRNQVQPFSELLGTMQPDSAAHCYSWRHLLRPSELAWLSGHQVQSQIVYPAAAYVCTALEASQALSGSRDVKLIELNDFRIHQAVPFNENDSGIETLTCLSDIRGLNDNRAVANFSYSAALGGDDMTLVAQGELHITFGQSTSELLPKRTACPQHMTSLDADRFYNQLATLGYGFDGEFKSLSSLTRKRGRSSGSVKSVSKSAYGSPFFIHPAELDGAIQSLILAFSYPGDDQLSSMHLPTGIARIRFNPALCTRMAALSVDSELGGYDSTGFTGDVNLYTADSSHAAIQIEGVQLRPMGALTERDDREMFSQYRWVKTALDGQEAACDTVVDQRHQDILIALEHISVHYLNNFDSELPGDAPARVEGHCSHYLRYARHVIDLVKSGQHKWVHKDWLDASREEMLRATAAFSHLPDVKMMHLVGETMPKVFSGETTMLEEFRVSDVLDTYYEEGFGFRETGLWMSRTIAQLSERFPHLDILEIGAGTGGATKRILGHLGSNFRTYTFTDISSGFFERGSEVFAEHRDRMSFKTLDCGEDPVSQGYTEGSYDVVVASLVVHATPDLELTLTNLRKLLRPGGYLVVAEGCNNDQPNPHGGFIFGPLPGWWLGAENGRPLSPFVSTAEWERLLKNTGFAGIDSTAPKAFEDILEMTVFATQAVDERVSLLREPLKPHLSVPSEVTHFPAVFIKSLVIIGGRTPATRSIVNDLKVIFHGRYRDLHHFETLAAVDYEFVNSDSTIVCMSELDKPVFRDISPAEFTSLKSIFSSNTELLWLTRGRLADEPFSNMTVGFARTAVHETPGLKMQSIDVESIDILTPQRLAEWVLRFHATISLTGSDSERSMTVNEPELLIDANGQELAPRLRPIKARNDRYNSARRPIHHDVDASQSAVGLSLANGVWSLQQSPTSFVPPPSHTQLRVLQATASAIRTPFGHKHLVLGTTSESHHRFLALVSKLSSVVDVPQESVVPCPVSDLADAALLSAVASNVIAVALTDYVSEGETMLIHNPPTPLSRAIALLAESKGVEAVFVADESQESALDADMVLPAYATEAQAMAALPATTSSFVGMSHEGSENEATLLAVLPPHCRRETIATLYSATGWESTTGRPQLMAQLLQRALHIEDHTHDAVGDVVGVNDLVSANASARPTTIVDWTKDQHLSAQVTPIDSSSEFFRSDRTYWMCGLSGALGISLCDWMIERGARYLVLTSRNPKVSPGWIASHARSRVNISIVPCNVSDETALRAAYKHICETFPPVAGVLNGAMVLQDVSIQNMSFEQMDDVCRPKVQGSMNLDRLFQHEALDFFILFSSINCVIGNSGQANYSAANTFMCSLAAQRRKRGLAATAVDIGAIFGAGYMERESSKALDLTVSKMALMHLSENDFHQLFAEAVDAGRPNSGETSELVTGLLHVCLDDDANLPRWHANPIFSSFTVYNAGKSGEASFDGANESINDQLASCSTTSDVLLVVKRTLAAQLRSSLQMTNTDEESMALRSSELGLDSLISVDLRWWFSKNFQVNVPVLKIMGNDTIGDIAEFVAHQMPQDLVPGIVDRGSVCPDGAALSSSESRPGSLTIDTRSLSIFSATTRGSTQPASEDGSSTSGATTPESCPSPPFKRIIEDEEEVVTKMTLPGSLSSRRRRDSNAFVLLPDSVSHS